MSEIEKEFELKFALVPPETAKQSTSIYFRIVNEILSDKYLPGWYRIEIKKDVKVSTVYQGIVKQVRKNHDRVKVHLLGGAIWLQKL